MQWWSRAAPGRTGPWGAEESVPELGSSSHDHHLAAEAWGVRGLALPAGDPCPRKCSVCHVPPTPTAQASVAGLPAPSTLLVPVAKNRLGKKGIPRPQPRKPQATAFSRLRGLEPPQGLGGAEAQALDVGQGWGWKV